MHPRNRHRYGYDFPALTRTSPELAPFVRPSPAGTDTVDFADPLAVTALNRALLRHHYGVTTWELPSGYLCPPIPGRAEYIHHLADLLAEDNASAKRAPSAITVLDVGVGANCIYPILGAIDYGWRFVGTDIDPDAIASARQIVAANPTLRGRIELRLQHSPADILRGAIAPGERFAASLCNPPFHASAADAAAGTARKLRNLHGRSVRVPVLNFGGRSHELWCPGGESAFVRRMIAQSVERPALCAWFTTLVAKRDSLPAIRHALAAARAEVRTIDLAHGQKKVRIVAWRFPDALRRR